MKRRKQAKRPVRVPVKVKGSKKGPLRDFLGRPMKPLRVDIADSWGEPYDIN